MTAAQAAIWPPTPRTVPLFGGAGNDSLDGWGGGDLLVGGPGRDTIKGRRGDDLIRARDRTRDIVSGGRDPDRGSVDGRDDVEGIEIFF